MSEDQIFKIVNMIALTGWLSLGILHVHKYTPAIVLSGIVFLLAVLYVFLISRSLSGFSADSFSTLQNVMALFKEPSAVLAGWVHYLAFDLFTGFVITYHSHAQGFGRLSISPCLLLTFLFGPAGWLLYYIMLCVKQQTVLPQILN